MLTKKIVASLTYSSNTKNKDSKSTRISKSSFPLVSIISVHFNNPEITRAMLNSLTQVSYPNFEVIVIDNGSFEKLLLSDIPINMDIQVIYSEENLGFAGANNLGFKSAKGKYYMLLNNDTEVKSNFLDPLVGILEANKNVGIASSKILYFDDKRTIQYAGSTPLTSITLRNHSLGFKEKDGNKYNKVINTAFAHGAAMMVRQTAIEKVGLMPICYFLYFEELDWCRCFTNHGYSILMVPQSIVYHKESQTVGRKSPLKLYFQTRNRILFARRQNKKRANILSIPYLTIVAIINAVFFLLKGEFALCHAVIKGLAWHVSNFNVSQLTHGDI